MVEELETRTQKYEYALADAVIQLALAKGKCEGVHSLYSQLLNIYSEQLSHIALCNKQQLAT